MEILLIIGGNPLERQFSERSAASLQQALNQQNYTTGIFDLKQGLDRLPEAARTYDIIFPVVHGVIGAGGILQRVLSELDKPYVGGDPKGFEEGWNKLSFKNFCQRNGIQTAPWQRVASANEVLDFGFPNVVKTGQSEFSKQVFVLRSEEDLKDPNLRDIFANRRDIFVEKFVDGTEVIVGILGDEPLPVLEIIPPETGFYDLDAKLRTLKTQANTIPHAPSLNIQDRNRAIKAGLDIHNRLDLGCYSRSDFIVRDGQPFALEVNTVVGLYEGALLPNAAEAAGISYLQLAKRLVDLAVERYNKNER